MFVGVSGKKPFANIKYFSALAIVHSSKLKAVVLNSPTVGATKQPFLECTRLKGRAKLTRRKPKVVAKTWPLF